MTCDWLHRLYKIPHLSSSLLLSFFSLFSHPFDHRENHELAAVRVFVIDGSCMTEQHTLEAIVRRRSLLLVSQAAAGRDLWDLRV